MTDHHPAKGGSYIRNSDGTLTLVERTEVEKPEESAAETSTETADPAAVPAKRSAKETK